MQSFELSNKINVSSKGLVVILGVIITIIVLVCWFLYVSQPVPIPIWRQEMYKDIPAPIDFSGPDCRQTYMPNNDQVPGGVCSNIKSLDDSSYVVFMAFHHQAAVTMAKGVLKTSQNQYILEMARNMVWKQGYEITALNTVLKNGKLPQPFSNQPVMDYYNQSLLSYYKGYDVQPFKCTEDMFASSAVTQLPVMTDREFLVHMIAHHQLALDMSRKQLKEPGKSKSIFMLTFLDDLIRDQEQELDRMLGLLNSDGWLNSRVLNI